MAPEQARGDAVDGRADLWSLGVVLYEMLTGERPAGAGHATEPVPAPSTLRERDRDRDRELTDPAFEVVPASVDALVLHLLAYSPQDRPDGAEDLLAALDPKRHTRERYTAPATGRSSSPQRGEAGRGVTASVAAARGRAVSYAGIGILIAVVGIGSYVYLQDGSAPGLASEAAAASRRFIAVLPFRNGSGNAENEYFADGVTDDVLAHLAQVPDFSVISRATTMAYKGSEKAVPEIADELGVEYVLTGTVRRADEQVRIFAQLVDGRTDQTLWTNTYDHQLEDIFAVQTEIARSIVNALDVELSGDVASRIERRPTEDMEAYELFLLGRENYHADLEGRERAMKLFRRALERDTEFASARAWLSRTYTSLYVGHGMAASWADSGQAEARRALAQQPDLADAYSALGYALTFIGQYEEAITALKRALELNPNDSQGADNLGIAYSHLGWWDEAIHVTRQALEREGVRSGWSLERDVAWYLMHLGLLDQAEVALEPALRLWPDDPVTIIYGGWIDLMRGEREAVLRAAERLAASAAEVPSAGLFAAQLFVFAEQPVRAREAAEAAYAQSPTAIFDWDILNVLYGYALERTGRHERARTVLAEAERYARARIEEGSERRAFRYSLARIHAMRGEIDPAFRWLDEAIDLGWNVAAITASDPLLENLRDDPSFQPALDRMEADLAPRRARVENETP